MSDWNGSPLADEDSSLGAPLEQLAVLRETPEEGFLPRIRNSINRRLTAAEVVDFSLTGFFESLLDYLTMIIQFMGGGAEPSPERNSSPEEDKDHE